MIITETEALTLTRLAGTLAVQGDLTSALKSFSDPDMVEALALRVGDAVYLAGESLDIERAS